MEEEEVVVERRWWWWWWWWRWWCWWRWSVTCGGDAFAHPSIAKLYEIVVGGTPSSRILRSSRRHCRHRPAFATAASAPLYVNNEQRTPAARIDRSRASADAGCWAAAHAPIAMLNDDDCGVFPAARRLRISSTHRLHCLPAAAAETAALTSASDCCISGGACSNVFRASSHLPASESADIAAV